MFEFTDIDLYHDHNLMIRDVMQCEEALWPSLKKLAVGIPPLLKAWRQLILRELSSLKWMLVQIIAAQYDVIHCDAHAIVSKMIMC